MSKVKCAASERQTNYSVVVEYGSIKFLWVTFLYLRFRRGTVGKLNGYHNETVLFFLPEGTVENYASLLALYLHFQIGQVLMCYLYCQV